MNRDISTKPSLTETDTLSFTGPSFTVLSENSSHIVTIFIFGCFYIDLNVFWGRLSENYSRWSDGIILFSPPLHVKQGSLSSPDTRNPNVIVFTLIRVPTSWNGSCSGFVFFNLI